MIRRLAWLLLLTCALPPMAWAGEVLRAPAGLPVIEGHGTLFTLSATVAATGNVNRDNPGTAVFDGVTLSTVDPERFRRVLLWQQTTSSQNGVYVWNGTGVAMTRPNDADESFDLRPGLEVYVIRGTTHAGKRFGLQGTTFPTVNTTALAFVRDNRFEPSGAVQLISAATAIACGAADAALRVIPVRSATAGTPVTITAVPAIAAGVDGQVCLIRGTDDTETVTVDTADYTVTFASGVAHAFIYSAAEANWQCLACITEGGGGVGGPSTDTLNAVHARGGTITGATVLNPFAIKDPNSAAQERKYWAGGVFASDVLGPDGTPANRHRVIDSAKYDAVFCGGVECERMTGAGVHSYSNVGKPTKSIWFDAAALSPDGTNCVAPTEQTLNSGPKTWAFQCADTTSSVFYAKVSMHRSGWDAGPIQVTSHLFHGTTETITHALDVSAMCRGDGDVIDNTWGTAVALDTAITTANRLEKQTSADITANGSCVVGDLLILRFVVDATNFSTTAANTRILGISLHYKTRSRNGLNE